MPKIRLKTRNTTEIRRTLTRVMNMAVNNEIDTKTANTVILGCNAVLATIRTDEQQKKIDDLEKMLHQLEMRPTNSMTFY